MGTLTVTAKGQVTLRREVLAHLGVGPGDKIDVDLLPDGRVEARAARRRSGKISDAFDLLHRPGGPTSTLEDIKDSIERGWAGEP